MQCRKSRRPFLDKLERKYFLRCRMWTKDCTNRSIHEGRTVDRSALNARVHNRPFAEAHRSEQVRRLVIKTLMVGPINGRMRDDHSETRRCRPFEVSILAMRAADPRIVDELATA